MSDRARRGWALCATVLPSFVIAATQILRYRIEWATAWPVWQPVILQLLLVIAGGILVAAVAAGIVAWRGEGRHHA